MGSGMADSWRRASVADLQRDKVLLVEDGNHGEYRPRPDEFVNSGTAFIRAADMDAGVVRFGMTSKINARALGRITKGIGAPGDVLLSHKGTVGKVAFVPDDAPPFVCSPQTTFWRSLNSRVLDRRFLHAFMRSRGFHAQLAARAGETDMAPYVSLTSQRALLVDLPPIEVQRAIVAVLGPIDDKIALDGRMNQTLEAMARALFKDWFIDFGPVRAKMEGRETTLPMHVSTLFSSDLSDDVPVGWRRSTLASEVARWEGLIQTGPFGSQLHAADYVADGVPVAMPKDLSDKRISASTVARVPEHLARALSRHRLADGDIVYSRRGDVERFAVVGARETGWLCGTGCLLVRPGNKAPSTSFLSASLDRTATRAWIVRHAVGATMLNLNTTILGEVPLLMPDDALLVEFDRICAPLVAKQAALEAESDTLASLRDLLLPQLLCGALRIRDAEQQVAEAL